MYADLHIHSTHSDGSLSPEEIVREAVAHRVGLIAVTDHELATGSLEAEPLARRAGLGFIRGAEVECRQDGRFHHLLAYGVNFKDPAFSRLIGASRRSLDDMSVELVRRMAPEYPHLSVEDFDAFERDPALGGWKGLEYLMRRGVTNTLREGMKLYGLYGVTYEDAGFPPSPTPFMPFAARGPGGAGAPGRDGAYLDSARRRRGRVARLGLMASNAIIHCTRRARPAGCSRLAGPGI